MDVMGQNGSCHSCLCVLERKEKTKEKGGEDGRCFSRDGSLKNEWRTLKLERPNTARQRFPDRGKQKICPR